MRIQVVTEWPESLSMAEAASKAFADGKAFQFYAEPDGLAERVAKDVGDVQVWYTERNGDGICMLCPAGTLADKLPTTAMNYHAGVNWTRLDR